MAITNQTHRPSQQIDGPWMADKRWAGGRISDGSTASAVSLWVFALFWNAIATTAITLGWSRIHRSDPAAYLLLLFPLAGLCLIAAAIYVTMRRLKFGKSFFELDTLPGCLGGWLAGTVRTSAALAELDYVRLTLRCIRRQTIGGSTDKRRTRESTLWENEQIYGGRIPIDRDGAYAIPIAFRIPAECRPTFNSVRDDVLWRLRLHSPMPGTDYAADFIVPVFDAKQADGFTPQAEREAAKLSAPHEAVAVLDDAQIDITVGASGRRVFTFPASRNRKAAAILATFASVFGAIGFAIFKFGGPRLLGLSLGVGSLICAYFAVLYWCRHIELDADRAGVKRKWRVLTLSGERYIHAGEIMSLTSESTSTVNDTPYYTIFANVQNGSRVGLVSGLRSADAEHVHAELASALGKKVDHAEGADQ